MTAVKIVGLIVGMAVVGVPIILGLLTPVAGWVVTRTFPETVWDDVMLVFAQGGAALATWLIGAFVLGLPWWGCLIAALIVGVTTFTRRDPMSGY